MCSGDFVDFYADMVVDTDECNTCYSDEETGGYGWCTGYQPVSVHPSYTVTWSGTTDQSIFSATAAGDYTVSCSVQDLGDVGAAEPDAGSHSWTIHVLPDAPPVEDGYAPPEMMDVTKGCSGYYVRTWDCPECVVTAGTGNSCSSGTCGGSEPQPPVVSAQSAGEAPRIPEPVFGAPLPSDPILTTDPVDPDTDCRHPFQVRAGKCHVFGPFSENAQIDIWSDGKHIVGNVSSGLTAIAVTVTYPNGETNTWSGSPVWSSCSNRIPITGHKDADGNDICVASSDSSDPGGAGLIDSATDASGGQWRYLRNDVDNPKVTTQIVRPDGTTMQRTLDADGKTVQIVTMSGSTVLSQVDYSYQYFDGTSVVPDPGGRLRSVTAGSKTTVYDYSTDNHTIWVREVYRSSNWPATADVVYSETEYVYEGVDANDLATTTVTRKHLSGPGVDDVTVYRYWLTSDERNLHVQSVTRNGRTSSYVYDAATGLLMSATDPKDRTAYWTYASGPTNKWKRQITGVTVKDSHEANANTLSELSYDYYLDDGDPRWLKTAKDARGNFTHYDRDPNHMERITGVKVAAGPTEPDWDRTIDPIPYVESHTYYEASSADGRSGQICTSTVPNADGNGHDRVTTYKYSETVDGLSRFFDTPSQVWCTNESGTSTTVATYTHDSAGHILSQTDADGKTTWFSYDPRGLLEKTIYKWVDDVGGTPDIYVQNHYMPCCGLLDWVRDENGDRTYYAYDDMKRVSKVWTDIQTREWAGVSIVNGEVVNGLDYAGNPVASYQYDALGRAYSATYYSDAATCLTTSCEYDANGRVTSIDYPGSIATEEFGYDSVGNLLYAKGGSESTYYTAKLDSLDRVTDVYLTGSGTLPNPLPSGTGDIRVAYEGATDLVTDVWRGDKHVTYSYDVMGRLKTYRPTSGPISGVNLWYDYNALGQKQEVKILDGSAATVHDTTYDYYPNGWLKSINYDGSKVAEYSHNALGLVSQIDFYSGGSATGAYDVYDYDANDPRDLLKTITMHYKDANGQPTTSVTDYTDGNGHPNVDKAGNQLGFTDSVGSWVYAYDHGGRISSVTAPSPLPEQGIGGVYGYDWQDNLANPPADPNHLVYDDNGQLVSWPGMYSYTYKLDGSPYETRNSSGSSVLETYTYRLDGLVDTVQSEGKTTTYSYDAEGIRTGASVSGGGPSQMLFFDPGGGVPWAIQEQTGGEAVSYVYDPSGMLVSRIDSHGQADYHFDATGSTRVITGSNGAVLAAYAYGADGKAVVLTTSPWLTQQPFLGGGRAGSAMPVGGGTISAPLLPKAPVTEYPEPPFSNFPTEPISAPAAGGGAAAGAGGAATIGGVSIGCACTLAAGAYSIVDLGVYIGTTYFGTKQTRTIGLTALGHSLGDWIGNKMYPPLSDTETPRWREKKRYDCEEKCNRKATEGDSECSRKYYRKGGDQYRYLKCKEGVQRKYMKCTEKCLEEFPY